MRLPAFLLICFLPFQSFGNPEETIVVTKFAGFKGGNGGVMGVYEKGAHGWHPGNTRVFAEPPTFESPNLAHCLSSTLDSILKLSQVFSMNKYIETGYLSRAEVDQYIANSVDFTDRPITFFQYLSSHAPEGGKNVILGDGAHLEVAFSRVPHLDPKLMPKGGSVKASLYTVAGQKMELAELVDSPSLKFLDLPWTKDPVFEKAAQKLNRDQYPLVWEIGRAASTGNFEFPHLLGLAGQDILKEVMHFGVPNLKAVDHAYISFHALNGENFEKFLKIFPDRVFARAENNANNAVFMVPLKEYLEKFPPSRYSEAHGMLKEFMGTDYSVVKSQAFLDSLKFSQYLALDVRYKGKNLVSPIFLSTGPSGSTAHPLRMLTHQYDVKMDGIDALIKKTGGEIFSKNISIDTAWPEKLIDPLVSHKIEGFKGQWVLQIGNLDPVLAKTDPDYVVSNIVAMFDHYARQAVPTGEEGIKFMPEFIQGLKKNNMRFMVTTHYPSTGEAIQKLAPKQKFKIDLSHDPHTQVVWEEMSRQSGGKLKRPSNEMQGFLFDVDQIGAFRYYIYHKNQLDEKRLTLIRPGYHWWLQGASEP